MESVRKSTDTPRGYLCAYLRLVFLDAEAEIADGFAADDVLGLLPGAGAEAIILMINTYIFLPRG